MKKFLLFIFTIVPLLTACNAREPIFDRLYPDTSSLEKVRKDRADEILAQELNSDFGHLIDSTTSPKYIKLTINDEEYEKRSFPLQFCWEKTYEECNDFKPINLHTDTRLIYRGDRHIMIPLTLERESTIGLTILPDDGITPDPDRFEVYILEKNGELTPYPSKNSFENYFSFQLPNEINTYFFILKASYEKYIGGVSYYVLRITLK